MDKSDTFFFTCVLQWKCLPTPSHPYHYNILLMFSYYPPFISKNLNLLRLLLLYIYLLVHVLMVVAVLAIVLVGLLYGFFIAIICGQRISERHHHVLAKQELTKVYFLIFWTNTWKGALFHLAFLYVGWQRIRSGPTKSKFKRELEHETKPNPTDLDLSKIREVRAIKWNLIIKF